MLYMYKFFKLFFIYYFKIFYLLLYVYISKFRFIYFKRKDSYELLHDFANNICFLSFYLFYMRYMVKNGKISFRKNLL